MLLFQEVVVIMYMYIRFLILVLLFGCSEIERSVQPDESKLNQVVDFQEAHFGPTLYHVPFSWSPQKYNLYHEFHYKEVDSTDWNTQLAQTKTWGKILNLKPDREYETFLVSYNESKDTVNSDTITFKTGPDTFLISIPSGAVSMGHNQSNEDESPLFNDTIKSFFVFKDEIQMIEIDTLLSYNKLYNCDSCAANRISWDEAIYLSNEISKAYALDTVYRFQIIQTWPEVLLDSVSFDSSKIGFRLLLEKEWEYLADNGTSNYFGQDSNIYGVQNLIGSVWEWVYDDYKPYSDSIQYHQEFKANSKVLRGGSGRESSPDILNSHNRLGQDRHAANDITGFRLAISNKKGASVEETPIDNQ